ncbi:Hcp family type VI secretion system effector [Erwinia pyrifoliae]|uniref:Hcp family type VI secretion system effector n=1 Tax=Erwinia pyrifoliae TaxID=79967 RepID=UPI0001C12FFA|nr:type VI secretion system tube protein Hcp [Erwinia pyrifoliae]CAY76412.1 putative type VI secretion system, effector protein hcp [Erwinia pyrifoliae DSM 12163]
MTTSHFMRVSGITGESQDAAHKGWTDILSFEWDVSQPALAHTGGGNGAGKVTFKDLTVVAFKDKATTALLKYCASGKHLDRMEVSVCKAGGSQMEYSLITLEDVLVTRVTYSGVNGGEEIAMRYGFQAASVRLSYKEQTASGGKGSESLTGWNIKENREI